MFSAQFWATPSSTLAYASLLKSLSQTILFDHATGHYTRWVIRSVASDATDSTRPLVQSTRFLYVAGRVDSSAERWACEANSPASVQVALLQSGA